ncbi:leucyl/phenylalanyl-tRNA--protein transferase [Photobacterium profundum]|uniref:Leucyl/phenylalanyl-tRNA--protein transferase n=1 Tax=Photobacterium profundum (strain SS9) TaxID=298386 RepID=LFTR_PHOPR|nr:leucyl/phenylalanyl-tRNA--protein transferase [Photobacterium profundum]Q6LT10.2 RecName: Full=Leucyl/phenylalanyl-tRNA--protein transferase; AltName: Full=L/F-transferase; AltName: Full=Leucyltransferase; AltName: Full=Phenyalanyltransferase [Photobacterium profundum SS9]
MAIYLPELDPENTLFPKPETALDEPNGLLAFGGDLQPARLLAAYRQGIFPWYSNGEPILWWSPAPRAIFLPNEFKPSKSLRKFYRKSGYQITLNNACHDVIRQCANCRSPEETWITEDMIQAYQTMHNLGHCHSVEVWHQDKLVGGFYGLQIGSVFCGESMFSLADNASKIALWFFCRHFSNQGGTLIDCQVMNNHLESLGALEIPRAPFMQQLHQQRAAIIKPNSFVPQTLKIPIE